MTSKIKKPLLLLRIVKKLRSIFANIRNYLMKYWIQFACKYLKIIYFPFFMYYRKKKLLFAINCANGVGHIFAEVDFLFRILHHRKVSPKYCIPLLYPGDLSRGIANFYKDSFYALIFDHLRFALLSPIPLLFPTLSIDIGLSRLKWYLKDPYGRPLHKVSMPYAISQIIEAKVGRFQYDNYYRLRKPNPNLYFMRRDSHPAIKKLQNNYNLNDSTKICLLQTKQNIANATARHTDPKTYLKSLNCLKELDYTLIFVGREKMPEIFKSLDVINYANSPFASFTNDIALFHIASIALIAGSGLSYLADCLGVPFLYVNSWHIANVPFGNNSINIPTIIRNKKTDRLLSFYEQINLFEENKKADDNLDTSLYEALNASETDIYEGLLELLALSADSLEKKDRFFYTFASSGFMKHSSSSFSKAFLKKHASLF